MIARIGWVIAAITLGLIGLVATGWIVSWGFAPWSLEGAWKTLQGSEGPYWVSGRVALDWPGA